MAATSGIGVSEELTQAFSAAVETKNVRFIKVAIENESLVPLTSVDVSGSLDDDLALLQDHLENNVPCYILARLDDPPSEWLAISYVPEAAKVRDKMLYAATRNSLTKSFGSVFTDSLFAISKSDVTPDAYAAHKRHQAAPKPLSAREQEIADIKSAEREAGAIYEGSRARQNHLGNQEIGYKWAGEAEEAVRELRVGEGSRLVVLQIDESEQIVLSKSLSIEDADTLSSSIPPSEPSYTLFAWQNSYSGNGRDIVFIYSCPSGSLIKSRMVYSSGALIVFRQAKTLLGDDDNFVLATRKIETSDPKELTEAFLKEELNLGNSTGNGGDDTRTETPKAPFARPKGPGRRR
ncbi:actin depolymerizing protein [Melanogaster broomeanus]|nr:actin depolymerizing protein [Melanogaster broomeanus]